MRICQKELKWFVLSGWVTYANGCEQWDGTGYEKEICEEIPHRRQSFQVTGARDKEEEEEKKSVGVNNTVLK